MPVVLSQRIDKKSDYDDVPFSIYHFPKRYRRQIKTGDIFLYYQGDRFKRENRYYFGMGVIGAIEKAQDGESYYAKILEGTAFPKKVPIYTTRRGYYESLDHSSVRHKKNPPWQSSVRPIFEAAFHAIVNAAGAELKDIQQAGIIEKETDSFTVLKLLNDKYSGYAPHKKDRLVSFHIDRGASIVNSLKNILGAVCQICETKGFEKQDGGKYIEAHHIMQIALNAPHSLCSDNIILVCPNCHRELHYGREVVVKDNGNSIYIRLGRSKEKIIRKNSIEYLESLSELNTV